jgi:PAP2 superfamily protein
MLTFFLARRWNWLRWITGIYLAMTLLAVFGTGEHYIVDAVVAIPYSLMIMAFCSTARGKIGVMLAGAGMLAIWLLVLRFGAVNPWTAWGLVSTTLALGFLIERRFAPSLLGQPAGLPRSPIPVG